MKLAQKSSQRVLTLLRLMRLGVLHSCKQLADYVDTNYARICGYPTCYKLLTMHLYFQGQSWMMIRCPEIHDIINVTVPLVLRCLYMHLAEKLARRIDSFYTISTVMPFWCRISVMPMWSPLGKWLWVALELCRRPTMHRLWVRFLAVYMMSLNICVNYE